MEGLSETHGCACCLKKLIRVSFLIQIFCFPSISFYTFRDALIAHHIFFFFFFFNFQLFFKFPSLFLFYPSLLSFSFSQYLLVSLKTTHSLHPTHLFFFLPFSFMFQNPKVSTHACQKPLVVGPVQYKLSLALPSQDSFFFFHSKYIWWKFGSTVASLQLPSK